MKEKEKTLKGEKEVANYNLANQALSHKQSQKGITLVALVVTIIVLLILAGVTIMTLFGENGLITMAQKAKSETENAQANAIAEIGSLANEMNSILNGNETSGGSSDEGTGGGDTPGEISFTIDGITYSASEGMTWKDWIESDFNSIGAFVGSDNKVCINSDEWLYRERCAE